MALLVHQVNDKEVFAYFNSLKDAFSNLTYVEQHDKIYLYKSDDSILQFPLEKLGQDFYLIIERDSDVEFTGNVVALPCYMVATIKNCAEEIGLDPKVYDVTHYIVVGFSMPGSGITIIKNDDKDNNNNDNNNSNNNNNNNDKTTETVYSGSVNVRNGFSIFGNNTVVRWMIPQESGKMPGLQVIYSSATKNDDIIVGNPAVAEIDNNNAVVDTNIGNTNITVGTAEVPTSDQEPEVAVDVTDVDSHTNVTVTPENVIVNYEEIIYTILDYFLTQN